MRQSRSRPASAAVAAVVFLSWFAAAPGSHAEGADRSVPEPTSPFLPPPGWTDDLRVLREPGEAYWRRNLFVRVLTDQRYLVTTWWPQEIRDPAFAAPLGAALIVAGSSRGGARRLDDRAELWVGKWIRGEVQGPAEVLSRVGDADAAVLLVGSTWLVARLSGRDRLAATSSLAAEALIDTAIWSTALKRLTSRARPGEAPSSRLLNESAAGQDYRSFPSGHAMGAFAVAAVVSGQYPERKWVPWVAYGGASLIAASRVALGRHYLSDVVAGAVLGRSMGRMVVSRARGRDPGPPSGRWTPIVDPVSGAYGIAYTRSW